MGHYKEEIINNLTTVIDGVEYEEEWKDVIGFETTYQVSSFGRVKTKNREVIYKNGKKNNYKTALLIHSKNRRGYHRVTLFRNGIRYKLAVHRLVAEAFISNPQNKKTVNHKSGDKDDNRALKLEWNTYSEQNNHSFSVLGRKPSGFMGNQVSKYSFNGIFICTYKSYLQAEKLSGVCKTSIIDCVNNRAKTAGGFVWRKNKI